MILVEGTDPPSADVSLEPSQVLSGPIKAKTQLLVARGTIRAACRICLLNVMQADAKTSIRRSLRLTELFCTSYQTAKPTISPALRVSGIQRGEGCQLPSLTTEHTLQQATSALILKFQR